MNSDSSARNESRAPRPVRVVLTLPGETAPSTSQQTPCNAPRNARVKQVGVRSPDLASISGTGSGGGSSEATDRTESEEYYDYDNGSPGDGTPQHFTNYDDACINLLQIDVPDCEEAPNRKDLSL